MSVSVVFVGSRFIRSLNRKFLSHDYVTDILAFPLWDDATKVDAELYVNLERARSQAREFRVSFSEEVRRLLVHGMLHVLGFDDGTERRRARMKQREEYYLAKLRERET